MNTNFATTFDFIKLLIHYVYELELIFYKLTK